MRQKARRRSGQASRLNGGAQCQRLEVAPPILRSELDVDTVIVSIPRPNPYIVLICACTVQLELVVSRARVGQSGELVISHKGLRVARPLLTRSMERLGE